MKVKICGITSNSDLQLALKYNADAVGFLVGITHKAEDKIDWKIAKDLITRVPPFVATVLVTHLLNSEELIQLAINTGVNTMQIHDELSPKDLILIKSQLPYLKLIKSVHVINEESINLAATYYQVADALLLDTKTKDRIGGTGITHDWSISKKIIEQSPIPVILAGGLNPDNVKDAIRLTNPFGVDVNSGVEINGVKDELKIKAFIHSAKSFSNLTV